MSNYKDPKEWGPHYWYVMKCVANNYPSNPNNRDKIDTRRFFDDIANMLPCETCINHYKETSVKYPIDNALCCRDCLIKWVNNVQSDINTKINSQSTRKGNVETKYTNYYRNVPQYQTVIPHNSNCNCGKH